MRCRKAKGMKQEALAAATGISRPRLSQIERGYLPTFETGVRIANALDTSLDAMLAPFLLSKRALYSPDIWQELAAMPPEAQSAVRRFVERLCGEIALFVPE